MHDLSRVLREMLGIADHTVIKTRAHCDQHIAVLHGHVGFVRAMHARHADELVVAGGESAQPHQCVRARGAGKFHQLAQFIRCIGQYDAAAGINHRPFGAQQHLDGFLDLPLMPLGNRSIRAHLDLAPLGQVLARGDGDVLGDIHQHGPGPAGLGDVKGAAHGLRQVLDVPDQEIMLDARPCNADGVAFLESILADRMAGHLAADDHHGNRIHIRRGDTSDGIGQAGAAGNQRDPDLVG